VVTLPGAHFDAGALWEAVQDAHVNVVTIVGDAFARPMLEALDAEPGRWDLSSLMMVVSSGVMWSNEVKQGLLGHLPTVVLFDSLGSSEAVGLAASVSAASTATFMQGPAARVIGDDGRFVTPGSGETGQLAVSGFIPVGYYKDPDKTARTFRTVDGVRFSIPGDYATVDADGTIHLLGRGSVVVNTGGEKVFPEEVEEVLKRHPAIQDAVVVGVADERFGELVCAVVEPSGGAAVDAGTVIDFVRGQLAHYKAPRQVVVVDTIGRSPSGKVDYRALKALAAARLGR